MEVDEVTTGELSYFHTDHLGTSMRLTSETGALIRVMGYEPFGSDVITEWIEIPEDIVITENITESGEYMAANSISITTPDPANPITIGPGVDVSFLAAASITFSAGFTVMEGAAFSAGTDLDMLSVPNDVETRYGFTGQEKDVSGLYYCVARYYDPDLGRFTQPDTLLDGLNRYAYCANNPVRYVDPTGNTHGETYWDAYNDYYSDDDNQDSDHPGTTDNDYSDEADRDWIKNGHPEVPPIVVNTVTWTASEKLYLSGVDIRFLFGGMTMLVGTAEVTFSDGNLSGTRIFDVLSTYSEGVLFNAGSFAYRTKYTMELPLGSTVDSASIAFEGIFGTAGGSYASKILSIPKTSLNLSPGGGYTFTIDPETKTINGSGWKGPTIGVGGSFGIKVLPLSGGIQTTAYKLKSRIEWPSNFFFNIPDF